jgi:hypothetical protein
VLAGRLDGVAGHAQLYNTSEMVVSLVRDLKFVGGKARSRRTTSWVAYRSMR